MARCTVYVGTSGWMYDWNPDGIDWYVRESGLNAVELNASFYRVPFRSQVEAWYRKTVGRLRWAVKVHQSVTHWHRLSEKAVERMKRFLDVFRALDPITDFYLVQLPPSFTRNARNLERLAGFARAVGLGARLAVEFRHESWFTEDTVKLCRSLGVTVVSVDSPMATWVAVSSDAVYLRLHGRSAWYSHEYSEEELREVIGRALDLSPRRLYVFLNNDHWMLENARQALNIAVEMGCEPGSPEGVKA